MKGFSGVFLAGIWAGILAAPAFANDSAAGVGVGGIELRQTDAVAMLSEDLAVSPTEIRVRYVFRNETDTPVETIVAFPLPELGPGGLEVERNLPDPWSDNFVQFQTWIDGQPVPLQVQHRVMLDGQDRAADLQALGVSPVPFDAYGVHSALADLPAQTRQALKQGGFLTEDGFPRWSLQSTFWRTQVFPPHTEVTVEHRYVPAAGISLNSWFPGPEDPATIHDDWWREALAAAHADYCPEPEALNTMRAALETGMPEGFATYISAEVDYILTTGANWRGPIGRFHLVVESPVTLDWVFTCFPGAQRIAPNRIEATLTDFTPTQDLRVYVSEAMGPGIERP